MMSILTNMSMSKKLKLSSGTCLVFMLLLGIVAYNGLHIQKTSINDIYTVRFKAYQTCAPVFTEITKAHSDLYKLLSWVNAKYEDKKISELGKDILGHLKESGERLTKLMNAPATDAGEKKQLQELLGLINDYNKNANDLIDLIQTDLNAATMYMGTADEVYQKIHKAFASLLSLEEKLSSQQYGTAMSSFERTRILVVVVLVVALLLSFGISALVQGIILGPVRKTVIITEGVASGDFTRRIALDSRDEIGQMAGTFDRLVEKLGAILGEVSKNSATVATSATQLSASSEQMATGSEEVAAQIRTIATAGEEMAMTSQEIARNCQLAAQRANDANHSASSGKTVVEETVRGMERIAKQVRTSAETVEILGQKSSQIGEIISTIEDIADQTNLLALNAAIEAARAGEQGRGFAVVADEVRALAERTTRATKEIGEMIKAIQRETSNAVDAMGEGVKEVESGTHRAAKSGEALQEILTRINEVTMQVNQIATAAEEQTATTTQISQNIQEITQVVHDTASSAHESARSTSQLSHLAEDLRLMVCQFKLS